jgi:serine/threonine protein kinase
MLDVPVVLELALSLASTLAEIHSRIKPSNIILEPSGQARLIDFGLATLQQIEHPEVAEERYQRVPRG